MKIFKILLFMVFCALTYSACQSDENEKFGSKWKLECIVDSTTGKQTVLEPTNCKECYTLFVDTNYIATARAIKSTFTLDLLNLDPHAFFEDIPVLEKYNGINYNINPFRKRVIAASDYSITSKQLILYHLGGEYLLFKPY
ncbi:MAG: hypothetical protein FWD66_11495 [Paludibacter sp.]|nr:hypothetical protein [Paludibacter sp.]